MILHARESNAFDHGYDVHMMSDAITQALKGCDVPVPGRVVAGRAGLPYKPTIDALGRMLDAGLVTRFGRKYRAVWALIDSPAGQPYDAMAAVEAIWRIGRTEGGA